MLTQTSQTSWSAFLRNLGFALALAVFVLLAPRWASKAAEKEDVGNPPPPKLIVDPPQAERLARGVVFVELRTENVQVLPVFGPAAVAVSPPICHLHVSVDEGGFGWAHTSSQPLIVAGLPPGQHKIVIELANANHKVLAREVVEFEVPQPSPAQSDPKAGENDPAVEAREQVAAEPKARGSVAAAPVAEEPPAKISVDPPQPGRLARGVVFLRYRTENLQPAPVFGPAALGISPRLGHLHVTVDDAPWHWVDASGGPLVVSGLRPGPHKILIELADANHQPLAEQVVKLEIPERLIAH